MGFACFLIALLKIKKNNHVVQLLEPLEQFPFVIK